MRCYENGLGAQADAVLDRLSLTHVWTVLTMLGNDDRSIPPPLEPMLPALAETVLSWSGGQRQVLVMVDSGDDPRVQVADLLAGVARRLPGINDALLQPLLSPTSLRDPER